jgi:uncharacterized membrane protein
MTTTAINRDLERYNSTSLPLPVNVPWSERLASIAAGARLLSGTFKNITSHPVRNLVMTAAGGYLLYRGVTGNCPLYTFIARKTAHDRSSNINIRTTVYVDKPRQEVYDFWRNLENLPLFMTHLSSVQNLHTNRSRWTAKLPGNIATVSWEAEIVNEVPGKVIGWKSIPGSEIDNAGKVEFMDAEDGHGTVIQAVLSYLPPSGGYVKSKIAGLLSPVFEKLVRNDLNSFKQYIEHDRSRPHNAWNDSQSFGQTEI